MLPPFVYPISVTQAMNFFELIPKPMIHCSIPNSLYFFKPLLPYYTWVNLACTNHWMILTSSQSFGSVLSLGIKFMIWSCLTCMDLVESLHRAIWACSIGFLSMCIWMKDIYRPSDSLADLIYLSCHRWDALKHIWGDLLPENWKPNA